ncbi:MAG: AsmA family protein [Burkholderiales bacterium]
MATTSNTFARRKQNRLSAPRPLWPAKLCKLFLRGALACTPLPRAYEHRMNIKIIKWSVTSVLAVLALCIVVLTQFDLNRAKPWLNARVSEATGRGFAINGDLSLQWRRSDAEDSSWHKWIPWPHISARDIVFGNPDWIKTAPNMVEVRHVTFSLSPYALLGKKIVVRNLLLEEPVLLLERAKDGKSNWTMESDAPSEWQLELKQIGFSKGQVHFVDAIKRADLRLNVDTLNERDTTGYQLVWKLTGSLGKEAVNGDGKAGDIFSLQQQSTPYPVEADVRIGKTAVAIKGTLTNPRELAALDVRLKLAGVSMAQLYSLTGIPFPETPAFATEGRLIGKISNHNSEWKYEKFSGRVGSSDLSGTFEYQSKQPRPYLKGVLVSNVLNFQDLAPLIGADSKTSKTKRDAVAVQPPDKILPVEPFKTERWTSIDANVKFTGRKIVRDKHLPIENLVTELHLQDGVLSLTPLNFGIADGNLISTIVLDGRGNRIKAQLKVSARHLKLAELFPTFKPMQSSLGEVNGDASLSATGNSVAAILGSANGEIKAFINGGTVSKLLLEQIGLNVGSIVLTQLTGDKQVKLNCMASDFTVTNGLMQTRTFLIDTEDAFLDVTGQINLAQEKLDLTIKPDTKTLRMISLRAPIYIMGSFKSPEVAVDKGVLALKTGAAVALGVLAPVLTALIPLVNVGPDKGSDCEKLLSGVRTKRAAPPPGIAYRAKSAPR